MTDEPEGSPPSEDGDGGHDADGDAEETADSVRSLLKGALGGEPDSSPNVLAGVQKKLRDRSGGKFYADEWSTAKPSPTLTFLVTSALMFAIVVLAYAVLSPLSSRPERVKMEPEPVEILAPPR